MRIEIFLLKLILDYVTGVLYDTIEFVPKNIKVVHEEEAPSLASCAIKCTIRKTDFVYDKKMCTCVIYLDDEDRKKSVRASTLSGTFYKVINFVFILISNVSSSSPLSQPLLPYQGVR